MSEHQGCLLESDLLQDRRLSEFFLEFQYSQLGGLSL
jgi:hypothetical protein